MQMFSLEKPEWKCKIDEGSVGLCNVHWAPDSRDILTTAQFQLRITVWPLISKNVLCIKYPKKLYQNAYVFSSLLKPYMASFERCNDSTNHVSIFDQFIELVNDQSFSSNSFKINMYKPEKDSESLFQWIS